MVWDFTLTMVAVVVVELVAAQDDAPSVDELSCALSHSFSLRAASYSAGMTRCWRMKSLPVARPLWRVRACAVPLFVDS